MGWKTKTVVIDHSDAVGVTKRMSLIQ